MDVAEYVEEVDRRISVMTDEYHIRDHSRPEKLVHHVQLAARISVLGTPELRNAWKALTKAEDWVSFASREEPDFNSFGQPYLSYKSPSIVRVDDAVAKVRAALRSAIAGLDAGQGIRGWITATRR